MKSVGLRIVAIMLFEVFLVLWIELLELLCFIVLLKSVDIIPIEMVLLFWLAPLPTPVTWIVPDGFRAASMPLFPPPSGEFIPLLFIFFLITPFVIPWPPRTFESPCGWYCVWSWAF